MRKETLVVLAIALVFITFRVVLLFARDPFYDEVYTTWMASQPFGSIIPRLLRDSGPPLYYFLARIPSVMALRWMSVVFAAVPLVLLLAWRSLGQARFLAATLLAVYPPAAMYATEARAYALCGMFVAIGVLLLDDDRPFWAAVAFVLAAYSHYYGVLFFPVLLTKWRTGASPVRAGLPFVAACVLFAPGLVLAMHQPPEAMAWNAFQPLLAPIYNLSFAGRYSPTLFTMIPLWLIAIGFVAFVVAVARSWRFAPAVLIPVGLALLFSLAGRRIYFPMRFESILAVPLVLWLAFSLERWQPAVRRALVAVLMIIGAVVVERGVLDHLGRPMEPCTRAALTLRTLGKPVVAADYCYLMAWSVLGSRVNAFPLEQAQHPGWRRLIDREGALAATRSLPRSGFFYIGHSYFPEFAAVRQARRVQLLEENRLVVAMWVAPEGLTGTLH